MPVVVLPVRHEPLLRPSTSPRGRRLLAAVGMSALLAACGGGGGDGDGTSGAGPATRPGGPFEFAQCTAAPTAVRWVRELDNGRWQTHRYVALGAEPLVKVVPSGGLPTGKNPEGVVNHGPLLAQNCTPGANGQTQAMRLRQRPRRRLE